MSGLQDDGLLEPQISDATLILRVRNGSSSAYGLLYERHVDSALATAGRYAGNRSDASDLVAEAFANVLQALQNGNGPEIFFRAYLLTTLRRLAAAKRSADEKLFVLDDLESVAPAVPAANTAVIAFENETVARSFRNLPERWQLVLWHTEIDGLAPSAVAPMLGMSANAVSALAVRAREGLKQAYLQNHLSGTGAPGCEKYTDQLGAYARHGLTARRTRIVQAHVDGCLKCTEKLLYLEDVGVGMRAIIFPALLGLAFAGKGAAIVGGGLGLGLKLGGTADLSASGAQGAGATGTGATGAGAAGAAAATGLGLPAVGALAAAVVAALVMVGGVVAAAVGVPFFGGLSAGPAAAPQTGGFASQEPGGQPSAVGAKRNADASASPPVVVLNDPAILPSAGILPPLHTASPPEYAGMPEPGTLPPEAFGPEPSSPLKPDTTVVPMGVPTAEPLGGPSLAPIPEPSLAPTSSARPTTPTVTPVPEPTKPPPVVPTSAPSLTPPVSPTTAPTSTPAPSATPTAEPTVAPTVEPTVEPSPTTSPAQKPEFVAQSSAMDADWYGPKLKVSLSTVNHVEATAAVATIGTTAWWNPIDIAVASSSGWTCEPPSSWLGTSWTCSSEKWSGEPVDFTLSRSWLSGTVAVNVAVTAEDADEVKSTFTF